MEEEVERYYWKKLHGLRKVPLSMSVYMSLTELDKRDLYLWFAEGDKQAYKRMEFRKTLKKLGIGGRRTDVKRTSEREARSGGEERGEGV